MKKEYLKNIPKFKKQSTQCCKSFTVPIMQTFTRLQQTYTTLDCIKLQNLLQTQKQLKPLDVQLKKEIFSFFLEKELKEFAFLKARSKISLRILKMTKVKLEHKKIQWMNLWQKVQKQFTQLSRKEFVLLQDFFRIIKIFFDQNNALQVYDYFLKHHGGSNQHVFPMILTFMNITVDTKDETFSKLLQKMIQSYHEGYIKPKNLLIYIINLMNKRKTVQLSEGTYQLLNNIILALLITPASKDAKNSIQSKFTKQHSMMISKFIGSKNTHSLKTIKIIFQISEKFINPFENISKTVRFLYCFIRFISKRKQKQTRTRQKLNKLIEKEILQQKQKQKIKENLLNNEQQPTQAENSEDEEQQDEELQSDDQKDKEDNNQDQIAQGDQQNLTNDIQQKKNQCLQILKNELSQQIMQQIKCGIKKMFNYIYFVNSKKSVSQFLRYSFILVPQLILPSLDLLDKAGQIPYINQQGLVANIKITVQYMLTPGLFKQSLKNLERILNRIINCSKIVQVWPIYQILFAKIPLLDQKDLQTVDDKLKLQFYNKFQINHDRFYQMYADNVMSAFKRMVRQGEFFQQEQTKNSSNVFDELLQNSYPQFKKVLISRVLQQITQNSKNQFIYNFFSASSCLPLTLQPIIQSQLSLSSTKTTQQSLQLRNNLVMLLCYNQSLSELKGYIRQFAGKNYYRVINMFWEIRAEFHLTIQPVKSDLGYLQGKQQLRFRQITTIQQRQNVIQQFRLYNLELVDQLHQLVVKNTQNTHVFQSTKTNETITKIVVDLYKTSTQTQSSKPKSEFLQRRKKIYQLLKLIHSILIVLKHKYICFNQQLQKFTSVQPLSLRSSLLSSVKFLQIVQSLLSSSQYLNDHKLTGILSQLITHEIVFNYGNQSRECKDRINRNVMINAYQELTGYCTRNLVLNVFIDKIKLIHSMTLLNQIKKQRNLWVQTTSIQLKLPLGIQQKSPQSQTKQKSQQKSPSPQTKTTLQQKSQIIATNHIHIYFDKIINQIKILIAAPGNEKSLCLVKTLLITTGLKGINEFIIELFRQTDIDSRFYWQKINEILEQFKNYGISFNVEQLSQLVQNHTKLLSVQNKKIKQLTIKSFRSVISFIKQQQLTTNKQGQHVVQKPQSLYKQVSHQTQSSKSKLLQILLINQILTSKSHLVMTISQDQRIQKMNQIWVLMKDLEGLVLSQTRIVRRLALFVYSLCFRKIKKYTRYYQIRTLNNKRYQPKNIQQFAETGFLRPQHYDESQQKFKQDSKIISIKRIQKLRKNGPYDSFQVCVIDTGSKVYELYLQIQSQSFQFIMSSRQVSFRFLSNFHNDMASTAQQFLSMSMSSQKPTQLSQLIIKQLEQSFYFFVPKKMCFDRVEMFFGERFFRYLMVKDAKNQFKFLFDNHVQDLIIKSMTNLQALDNRALVFILIQDIVLAYQKQFDHFNPQVLSRIQKFILFLYHQTAKKASGEIFKKWGIIFKKILSLRALSFLTKQILSEIQQHKRIPRNALTLLTIDQHSLKTHHSILQTMLNHKIQLQNTIVNKIINTIMILPDKYHIRKQEVKQYGFIDLENNLKEKLIQGSTGNTFYIKNQQFRKYLLQVFTKYVGIKQEPTQSKEVQQHPESLKSTQIKIDQTTEQKSKHNDFYKNAYTLILNAINCFCHCFQSSQNMTKVAQLIQLIQIMSLNKDETQVIDYKQLQPIFKVMFGYGYENTTNFQIMLTAVMKFLKVLPSKRQAQVLSIALSRPYNFIMLSEQKHQQLIYEIFMLQETTTNYKQLISNLSVILSFRSLNSIRILNLIGQRSNPSFTCTQSVTILKKQLLSHPSSKRKLLLYYHCIELSTLSLCKETTQLIMSQSTKDRKNVWCREMLAMRGKKEYLDDQEMFYIWKRIKDNSNPYNYIV